MRTKKTKLATDSIILTFVQCVTLMTSIIQTMLLSRILTKTEYGTYSQGVLVVNFITPFLLLGLSNAINYFYNQVKTDDVIKRYVDTTFATVTFIGALAGILLIFFRKWICLYFNNEALYPLLVFTAFRPLFRNLISLYQPLFISNNMAKMIAIRNLLIAILQVGIIGGVLLFSKNLVLIFGLLLILDFLQVIFFNQIYKRYASQISFFKIDKNIIPEIFQYAVPLAFATMVGTLSVNMDKMLIGRMFSADEFAVYSNMAKELPFSFVVTSLTTVVTPVLLRLKHSGQLESMRSLWSQYVEIGFIATWILVAGAIPCGKELITFLYSKEYIEGYWIFIVYLLVMLIRGTYFGMILTIYEKTRQVFYFSCATLLANLILNYLLINCFGVIGPAVATLISTAIMGILQMNYSFKLITAGFFDLFNFREIAFLVVKILLVLALVCILDFGVIHRIESNTLRLLLKYLFFIGSMILLEKKRIKYLMGELNSIRG